MAEPLLSIITINYNNAEGIKNTLNSIFSQKVSDYSLFEYIVIDGASKDDSVKYIKEAEEKNTELNYVWISEPDSGIYNAMNKGVKKASGKYLYMLNSGDYLQPDVLEEMLNELKKDPDLLLFAINHIQPYGIQQTEIRFPASLKNSAMGHQGMIYKKAFHDQYGLYSEKYRCASDYEFCVKAFYNKNIKLEVIYKPCVNFILGGVGESSKSIEEFQQIQIEQGLKAAQKKSLFKKVVKAFIPYGFIALYKKIQK